MKSLAERLDEILDDLYYNEYGIENSKKKLIALFMECVPEKDHPFADNTWDACRTETLKKMEELRK